MKKLGYFQGSGYYFLILALMTVVVFSVYLRIIDSPFVFDDRHTVLDNPSLHSVSGFIANDFFKSSRPVVDLSFAFDYAFYETSVFGYHIGNIFIHIFNSFLVFVVSLLSLRIYQAQPGTVIKKSPLSLNDSLFLGAFCASLIFALHPIQTQAVTYIAQRYTSMAALFSLACVLFYILGRLRVIKALQEPGRLRVFSSSSLLFLISVICAGLAFLSKQSALILPGLILLVEYCLFTRSLTKMARVTLYMTPFIAVFAAFVLYFTGVLKFGVDLEALFSVISSRTMETDRVSRWIYLCTQFQVIVLYLKMVIWPAGQNIDHMYPFVQGFLDGWTPLGFGILIIFGFVGVWFRKMNLLITLGIFWFFIALSVESSIIPISDAMFEHRMYLPMFGISLLAGTGIAGLNEHFQKTWLVSGILLVLVLVLGTLTVLRNEVWRDPQLLWSDSIAKNPDNSRAWANLGRIEYARGDLDLAEAHFEKALELNKGLPSAQGFIGMIKSRRGDYEEALPLLGRAVEYYPRSAEYRYNYGVTLGVSGRSQEAEKHYRAALRYRPQHTLARMNLGVELARQGRLQEAVDQLYLAHESDPDNFDVSMNLGLLLLNLQQFEDAATHLSHALELRGDNPAILTYLGIASFYSHDYEKSIESLTRSLNINPGNPTAMNYLQRANRAAGRTP